MPINAKGIISTETTHMHPSRDGVPSMEFAALAIVTILQSSYIEIS
jgi:hypothetical protein